MAAELEQLRKYTKDLAKQFRDAGQGDLAALLDVDAQGFDAKAKIAKEREMLTLKPTTPNSPSEQIQDSLGLTREQVAKDVFEVTKDTKAYVGPLVNGRDNGGKIVRVFEKLAGVDHIFTAEGKRIPRWRLEIDDRFKTADELIEAIENIRTNEGVSMRVSGWAKDIMRTPALAKALQEGSKTLDLIIPEVRDLGLERGGTTKQVFDRGVELGLDKCDLRVGPFQRMVDKGQKMNDWYWVAMDTITDSDGYPSVFALARGGSGAVLSSHWAGPGGQWDSGSRVVFSLPQVNL